jgi:hypothetical protein
MSAIFMASSSTLMTQYYDRERNYRYAAEQALQIGVSELAKDTAIHLADTGHVTLLSNASLTDANGVTIPNTYVNLYVGMTGNTTGQFGQFASLVAEVNDANNNTKYVRRLELMAQNFARYAMFTNQFSTGLCYGSGEFIRGLGFSNQGWYSCSNPTYYDTISAVLTVSGGSPTYVLGSKSGATAIAFPTVSRLAALPGYASAANYSFTPNTKGAMRIEFMAINLNPTVDSDSSEANEGFFRLQPAVRRLAHDQRDDRVLPVGRAQTGVVPHADDGRGARRRRVEPRFVHGRHRLGVDTRPRGRHVPHHAAAGALLSVG